ncbi:Uncharacterised protein [Yersinia intermedia]|nr:Uncharacterised protein [Yersinia intermedia]
MLLVFICFYFNYLLCIFPYFYITFNYKLGIILWGDFLLQLVAS